MLLAQSLTCVPLRCAGAVQGKKKKAKAPSFVPITTFPSPSYGIANVKLAAPKKGKKK